MENATPTSDTNSSTAVRGPVLLEDMTRDDLLKQAIRQRHLMQKMKNKCDELNKRCAILEKEKGKSVEEETQKSTCLLNIQITELKSQIDILNAEKEQAIAAYTNIQAAQEQQLQQFEEFEQLLDSTTSEKQELEEALKNSNKRNKVLEKECRSSEEQMECMKLKLDTLTSTCQYLQEDLKKIQVVNTKMENDLKVMESARDEALHSLKGWKEKANENLNEIEKLKGEAQILKIERNELLEKLNKNVEAKENLLEKVEYLQEEKENLIKVISDDQQKMNILKNELESKEAQISESKMVEEHKVDLIKKENEKLKVNLEEMKNENSALIMKFEQLSIESEHRTETLMFECNNLSKNNKELIEELKETKEKFNNELCQLRNEDKNTELNEAMSQMTKLENKLSVAIQEKQDAAEELFQVKDLQRFVEDEAAELREENEKLKTEIKTLEADLENDKLHIRKLEKELHLAEERERECNIEYEKIRIKLHELEETNKELRDNIVSEEIEELIQKCKSLETEKEVLSVQVENLTQEINLMNQYMLKQNCNSYIEQDSQTDQFYSIDKGTSTDIEFFDQVDSNIYLEAVNGNKESLEKQNKLMEENACSNLLEKEFNDTNLITFEKQFSLENSVICDHSSEHLNKDINKEKRLKDEMNSNLAHINRMNIDVYTQTETYNDNIYTKLNVSKDLKSDSSSQIDVKEKGVQSEKEECIYDDEIKQLTEEKLKITGNMETILIELNETKDALSLLSQEKSALQHDQSKLLNDKNILNQDFKDAMERVAVLTQMLQDKSEIAEKIHCQMDSLLCQIDELNMKLQEKESDLISAGQKLQNKTEEIDKLKKDYELKNEECILCKKELETLQSDGYHLANECPLIENYNKLKEKNDNLQDKCNMLQTTNDGLEVQLHNTLTAEIQKSEEISALAYENESLQLLRREQENEMNHLSQMNQEINDDLNNAKQEINILNNFKIQCEQYEIDNNNLQKEKGILENEILLLSSKLEHSESEIISQLQEDTNKSNMELASLKDEIVIYQSKIDEHKRTIDDAITEKQKAEKRVYMLEEHLKTIGICSAEKCYKVQEEAKSLKKELESMKHYINNIEFIKDLESMKHYIESMKCFETESELLKIELKDKQTLIDDYSNNLEESRKELANAQSLSDNYIKQNLVLEEELKNLKGAHINCSNEIESFKEKLLEQTHLLEQLEREKSNLLKEITSLKRVDTHHVQSSEDIEKMQKEMKDSDDRLRKMKALALKTKKELADVKKQLANMTEERNHMKKRNDQLLQENDKTLADCRQYLSNFQSLQSEYDKIEDKYEAERLQTKQLQQDIAHSMSELASAKERLEELKYENESLKKGLDTITSEKKCLEQLKIDLEGKIIVLDSLLENETKKHDETRNELQNVSQKMKQLEDQLKSERFQHTSTTQQLEQALKEAKQQNLLNLEIDDYKRIVSETKANLEEKIKDINEMHSQLACEKEKYNTLVEEMKHVESQWKTEESRANNLKELLSKTKDELSKLEQQEMLLNEKLSEQQSQLERFIQQEEIYKVQLSEASAENRKLHETLQNIKDSHGKTTKSLETKIDILEEQLRIAGSEVESTKEKFESYKIRVHSVLKQKKEQSPVISVQDETKQQMEKVIDQSRAKLEELSEKLQASLAENSVLQEERDQLIHHLTKLTEEIQMKEGIWNKRLNQMIIERDNFQKQEESLSEQLQQQNEMLTATFKQRLQAMQEKHTSEINAVQKQLEAADVEISHLQREYQKSSSPSHPQDDMPHFDIFSQERQEGEGSECTDRESITPIVNSSLSTVPSSGFLPFEQLLQMPTEPLSPLSITSNQDIDTLSSSLATAQKKLEHVTELLNESEANNLRMTEQVRVLKEEIRRLERNKERQDHAENLEYLKNIVVKFITLEGGDERLRLIPVLTTMLRLSPEEQAQMLNIASGEAAANASSGWGNYLHRWSGLV